MEFIFSFSPCVNLAICAVGMFGLWFAMGGIATIIERIIKGMA